MDIPKKKTITLIRAYAEGNDEEFRTESLQIARELYENGEEDLALYIVGLFSDRNYMVPQ